MLQVARMFTAVAEHNHIFGAFATHGFEIQVPNAALDDWIDKPAAVFAAVSGLTQFGFLNPVPV